MESTLRLSAGRLRVSLTGLSDRLGGGGEQCRQPGLI